MAESLELVNQVRENLDSKGLHYNFFEEKGVFRISIGLVSSKLRSCDVLVTVQDDLVNFYTCIPIRCDETSRLAVAEFLTRVNYRLSQGNFEMDFSDGEIRYKVNMPCSTTSIYMETFSNCLHIGPFMVDRYGNGLLSVIFGNIVPEDAVRISEESYSEQLFKLLLEEASGLGLPDTGLGVEDV